MSEESGPEPEPTRPNLKWLMIGLAAVVVIAAATHWPQVSAFAHLPEIEHSLGLD